MSTDTLDAPVTTTTPGTQDAPAAPAETTAAIPEQGAQATASADTPPAAESEGVKTPTEYEAFTLPEGIKVDEELLGEFKSVAQELNLSQKDAQKLADIQAKAEVKRQQAMEKVKQDWREASLADQEFGGEKLQVNLGVAKKAMDTFATPEMRKLLDESGFGNHPEVIRHFIRVGKAISEDGRIVTGSKAAVPSDPAKRLFPNQA
jgi:hypothetical protein